MKYVLQEYNRNISDEELLDDLLRVAKHLKKDAVSTMEYSVHGKYNSSTIMDRFGVWNNALNKAGLKVRKVFRVSHEELLYNLKRVWDTLGRQPRWVEMIKPLSRYRPNVYANHFGTWTEALREFVKAVNDGKLLTKPAKRSIGPVEALKMIQRHREKKISKGLRYDVLRRDNFKCRICGKSPVDSPTIKLHVDHIRPISKGGETIMSNLRTLCSDCNIGKFNKDEKKARRGQARKSNSKKQNLPAGALAKAGVNNKTKIKKQKL